MTEYNLKEAIREIPDFPKPGILFYDVTTLIRDAKAFSVSVETMAGQYQDQKIDYVVGVESRGFVFGAALAMRLGVGLVLVRKKGKLPYKTRQKTYDLEYGQDTLEIHEDALAAGDRVLIVDDLLATGGTVRAVADMVQEMGAELVGAAFVVELTFLPGREKLGDIPVFSIVQYADEEVK